MTVGALKSSSSFTGDFNEKKGFGAGYDQTGFMGDAIPPPFGASGNMFFMEYETVKGKWFISYPGSL